MVMASAQSPCDTDGNNCPLPFPTPKPHPGDGADLAGSQSVDPNELLGPTGVDSVRWVGVNDVLNYTIFFENDPEFATAHAQMVDVRFDFPDKRLMKGFTLGNYCFGNKSFTIENEPNIYATRLDLRDSLNIYVDVIAGLEVTKNQAFWTLSSIDPETGFAPWQSDLGILAINDSTHAGEGFVNFRLRPYEGMETGDTISFAANIVFDTNDTIPTNNWKVTVDAGKPTSKVIAIQSQTDYTKYNLSFDSSDDEKGCGVGKVYLYLADNLGVYQEYAVCPSDSIIEFNVEQGRQYKMFSIAEDRVGNREDLKAEPDVILNFNQPPTDLRLSNTSFQDDIMLDGFIGELSTVDTEDETEFTYELADGEGAIHNDMFAVVGNRLQANDCFKCANDTIYKIRLSTTDTGGLTYSKPFVLNLIRVLDEPEPKIIDVDICEGDVYDFYGESYNKTGTYSHRIPNEFMCDSIITLNLRVNPIPEPPTITISGKSTLISSAERGNQWYKDGSPIDDATEQQYTATETGLYSVTASNGRCESEPSEEYFVNLDTQVEYTIDLSHGWSWFSSNSDDPEIKNPNTFFSSVKDNLQIVYGDGGELENNAGSLQGSIASIEPLTYKVKMSNSDRIQLKATPIEPEEYSINLKTGWTWIPYIPTVELDVNVALSNFTPQENDVIKSQTQFSTFSNGKWIGTLNEMTPYGGYMYYTPTLAQLHYSPARVRMMANVPMYVAESSAPWHCDASQFAHNTTMIATLYDKDIEVMEGAYSVGAFCNEECRGVGEYVDGKLFITIHGQTGDHIKFKSIENVTNKDREICEQFSFDENPRGTMSEPFKLTLGEATGIDNVYGSTDYNIYPNPVRETMFIEGDLSDVTGVKVITVSGVTLISTDSFEHGVNVSSIVDGVYVAAIITPHGVKYIKFLKKGY